MAFPSTRYIESPSIQNYFVDHDSGFPLAAGVVTFYRDVERTVLKPIYQQVQLADNTYDFIQLPNPITLNSVGTYDDGNGNDINVFLYPHVGSPLDVTVGALDLYFVTVYSSDGRLQETREAWPPNAENNASTSSSFDGTDNVILNPQFVDVYFTENAITGTFVYNVSTSGEISSIAPGWDFITEGTGTITVSQVEISDTAAPSNPPYALNIQLGVGVSSCHLTQRIYSSPRFLKDNILSGYFIAKANTAATPFLTLNYMPSNSTTSTLLQQICSGSPLVGSFNSIFNTTGVTITIVNPDTAPLGYVDIYLDIPPLSDIQVSSFQVISVANPQTIVDFIEQSTPQQINQEYNYDKEAIYFKPIPSLLTGWDFPLNPMQFDVSSFTTVAKYVWDQTICRSFVGTVNVSKDLTTGSLKCITTNANEAFYTLQYLTGNEAIKTTWSNLSVNINAYTKIHSGVVVKAYLYFSLGSGTIPVLPTTIGTIDGSGNFTLTAANWSILEQSSGNSMTDTLPVNLINNIGFIGWDGKSFSGTAGVPNFAIVITYSVPSSGTEIYINSIALTPGDIPTQPAPQTEDEVLRECQYYYEKSYGSGVFPGAATATNQLIAPMAISLTANGSGNIVSYGPAPTAFGSQFTVPKRTIPTLSLYSIAGTINNVSLFYTTNGVLTSAGNVSLASNFNVGTLGTKAFNQINTNVGLFADLGATNVITTWITYHYEADARLGIV